jgi:hypothetical protein
MVEVRAFLGHPIALGFMLMVVVALVICASISRRAPRNDTNDPQF